MQSLKNKTFRNIGYNTIATFISYLFRFIISIMLARTLVSSDYGVVGFAMVFTNFLTRFKDLGINPAVVHRRNLDELGLYTGFTMKICLGIVLAIASMALSGLSRYIFNNEAVSDVIKLLSLNFIVDCFAFLPVIVLTRELNYKKISLATMVATIFNGVTTVILALAGFKYWSIVFGNICASLVMTICLYWLKPVKLMLKFNYDIAKELLNYGWGIFLSGIILFAIANIDNFVVGAVKGDVVLGYYMIAFNWGTFISLVLGTVIGSVLFPTFTKMGNDTNRIKRSYLKIMEYIWFTGILVNFTLYLVADDFLVWILGKGTEKWLPSLSALQILCFCGIIRVALDPIRSVMQALGRTTVLAKSDAVTVVMQLLLIYPTIVYFGIEGVAIIMTIAFASQYCIYSPLLKTELNMSYKEMFLTIWPAFLSAAIVTVSFMIMQPFLTGNSILVVIIKPFAISLAYIIIYGLNTKWKLLTEMRLLIKESTAS